MERRSKHLSSEERGVFWRRLFAAPVSGRSAPFLTDRQARFVASGLGVVRMTVRIPRNQRGWFTTFTRHDVCRTRCRRARKLVEGITPHSFVHKAVCF